MNIKDIKFKLNTDKRVLEYNREQIRPGILSQEFKIRSTSYTPEMDDKMNKLRARYKISRSAIIRILLEQVG